MTLAASVRDALASLPRADNHRPGESVALEEVYTVRSHRSALNPDRALVVGNRGMGKSFWAHALTNYEIRNKAATDFGFPALRDSLVLFGFNGSEKADAVAPTPLMLQAAVRVSNPGSVWRGVLARAAATEAGERLPESFQELVSWIETNPQSYAELVTRADDRLHTQGRRMLLLFDALDRLSQDWATTRNLLQGLLQLALSAQSFRSLRLKLFLRLDQFSDPRLFEFPDASKIQNTHVSLQWDSDDLYGLLFQRLRTTKAFPEFETRLAIERGAISTEERVNALAGEFMGVNEKRGRVYTWLSTHLADALGQISPRTFLTAWRVAGEYKDGTLTGNTPVNHHGILEGVREASKDRLAELGEDYPWVRSALSPLSGQSVPLDRAIVEELWRKRGTVSEVIASARPVIIPAQRPEGPSESDLINALKAIGVIEIRQNAKLNVPDIFRVEAGIKRRGGVKPPRRDLPS